MLDEELLYNNLFKRIKLLFNILKLVHRPFKNKTKTKNLTN